MQSGSPTLDRTRWTGLWRRLGARGDGLEFFEKLSAAYQEPVRAYHTTAHILDCLAEFDGCRELAVRPDEVEAGLWFHDAVYVPGALDNERRSALMAESGLAGAGAPAPVAQRVGELVLATQHLAIPYEPDAQLICDIDLAILGRNATAFDRFEEQIRREYAWVPEKTYRGARSGVLAGFLRRTSIYQTSRFAERYEVRARENLERALRALSS